MFHSYFVNATDLNDAWFSLLFALQDHGRRNLITKGSFEGGSTTRFEFDKAAGFIKHPTTRPLAPIMPIGCDPITTDDAIRKYFWDYMMNGKIESKNEHYKYATWINGGDYEMPYFNVKIIGKNFSMRYKSEYGNKMMINVPSQVDWVIKHFKEGGYYNNHCYIQVGYPESSFAYDVPYNNPNERQTSPCLRGIDFKIINVDNPSSVEKHDYLIADTTFRCLSGDTSILYKENGNIRRSNIKELYNSFRIGNIIKVLSISKDKKPLWSNVTDCAKSVKNNVVNLNILGSGNIRITDDHRIPVIEGNAYKNKYVKNLSIGDEVLELRKIDIKNDDQLYIDLFDIFKNKRGIYVNYISPKNFKLLEKEGIVCTKNQKYNKHKMICELKDSFYKDKSSVYIKCQKIIKPRMMEITRDMCYFMGLWLADGWYHKRSLKVAIDKKSDKIHRRVLSFLKNEFKYEPSIDERDGCLVYNISIIFLKWLFEELGFIHGSKVKYIPSFVYNLDKEHILNFIEGWYDGDSGVSTGKNLISDFSYIMKVSDILFFIYEEKSRISDIKGRKIIASSCQRIYPLKSDRLCYDNIFIKRKIKSITKINEQEEVYDISVDSDSHLFFCGNTPILVHNSWDLHNAFPVNMGGVVLLMEYIAEMLGIRVGGLGFNCIKLHVYSHDISHVQNRLNRK